jgi:hypothetical protein
MSLPDSAEYWWHIHRPQKFHPKHGVRKCPNCGVEVTSIKAGKKHWKKEHSEVPLPDEFPLVTS